MKLLTRRSAPPTSRTNLSADGPSRADEARGRRREASPGGDPARSLTGSSGQPARGVLPDKPPFTEATRTSGPSVRDATIEMGMGHKVFSAIALSSILPFLVIAYLVQAYLMVVGDATPTLKVLVV